MNTAAPANSAPLAELRDIHLPSPVSGWPPAPGWWLVALLLIALITIGVALWLRHRRRNAYRRIALNALRELHDGDAIAINALLKRTALAAGFNEAAALSGEAWLQFLERTRGGGAPLLQPALRDALLALYAPPVAETTNEHQTRLKQMAKRWIGRHRC